MRTSNENLLLILVSSEAKQPSSQIGPSNQARRPNHSRPSQQQAVQIKRRKKLCVFLSNINILLQDYRN